MEYKNMKIAFDIKKRIDVLKGRKTYGEFFDSVLRYFEMTGVDPTYGQLPPAVTITKTIKDENAGLYRRMEDVIKIMRNIETTKIDLILHGLEDIMRKGKNVSDPDDSIDIGPQEKDMLLLIDINEKQEVLISSLKKEIGGLKSDNSMLKMKNINKGPDVVELVEELLSDKVLGKDGVLTREYKAQLFEKMKQIAYV